MQALARGRRREEAYPVRVQASRHFPHALADEVVKGVDVRANDVMVSLGNVIARDLSAVERARDHGGCPAARCCCCGARRRSEVRARGRVDWRSSAPQWRCGAGPTAGGSSTSWARRSGRCEVAPEAVECQWMGSRGEATYIALRPAASMSAAAMQGKPGRSDQANPANMHAPAHRRERLITSATNCNLL